MHIFVNWDQKASLIFPKFAICIGVVNSVCNERENIQINNLKKTVYDEVKTKYNIETLKGKSTVRAYRDFYWKLGIDPTKTSPSGETLLRRVLHGDTLPQISTVVDAHNLSC